MTKIFVPIVLFCALLTSTGYAAGSTDSGADAILGTWVTEGGKAHVEVTGADGVYQGRIIWLKEPDYPADDKQGMGGQAKVDRENPDAGLRKRPIIGLQLVSGFHYAGDGVWTGGTIYDPESGKTYRCKITLRKDGSLNVRGYIGFSLFGRTTVWTRLAANAGNAPSK